MASFNLTTLADQLNDKPIGTGVSFAKRSLKLDTAEDAAEVIQAIKACPNLEYLDLEGNTLGPLAAQAIAEVLKEKGSSLKRALWKDMFTSRSKTEIPKALEYLGSALSAAGTMLTELDLSDNALGPIGIEGLAAFLASSSCYTLRELRLNNNGLGISGGKMLAQALINCNENSLRDVGNPLALKVFVAGRNRLENEGATALASVFKKLNTLEEVVMPQNSIYHAGITALAEGLSSNRGLRILNLNDNTIHVRGAQALAKVLPNFRNLEHINLGDCLLKTKGALVLAEALAIDGNHPSLIEVNLSGNDIHTEAADPIAQAMADKTLLEILELNGNNFGTMGRDILRNSLVNLQRMESLSTLSDDCTGDEDDEDDEDEDEDEEDEEEEDEDNEDANESGNEIANGNRTNSTIQNNAVPSRVTVADFLKSPIGEKLLLLPDDNGKAFMEYAKNIADNSNSPWDLKFTEEYMKIIMKVSALCGSGYLDVRIKAERLTDKLYADLFEYAVQNNRICFVNNVLLVNLGLIKSEEKKVFKIDWDLEGCFKALEKICQRDYFLPETRETLKLFLSKPVKISRAKVVYQFESSKISLKSALDRIQTT